MLRLVPLIVLLLASAPGGATDWLALTGSSNLDMPGNLPTWMGSVPAIGPYEVRLFLNEGYVRSARSPVTTVADSTPATTTANPMSAPGVSSLSAPVLYFTDLASGPRSGNGDTSRGQSANRDGALVTVWGQNLGTSQGTSTITLGGVAPAAIYYWGNATAPNCGAATLFNAYQKLQCIIFQVNHATAPGAQNIVVTVGGVATNALSFTVRTSGAIFFVAPTGGKFTSIQAALDRAALGDVIYVKNGSDAPGGVSPPASTKALGAPLALVVYPGHSVQVGDATHRAFDLTHSQSGKQMVYSKFTAWGPDVVVLVQQDGRFVGNLVQAPNGVGSTGAVTSDAYQAAPNRTVLGNEITNVGTTNRAAWDNLYHTIYFGGLRDGGSLVTGVEIGWNYIHDNKAFRAINLFAQLTSADSVLAGVNIHDNVIVNQQGPAVLFGRGLVGTLRVYNNLFINTGQDYSLDSQVVSAAYTAIDVRAGYLSGWAASTGPVTVDIFNNTMLNSGAAASNHRGVLYYDPDDAKLSNVTLKFRNNLVDQATGVGYMVGSTRTPAMNATNIRQNLWHGAGAAPAWDTSSVNADPLLVSAVRSYDPRLQAGSPAIGTGANLTGGGLGLLDFDGRPRPASGAWSIGAYQFGTQAAGVNASGQDPTSTGTVAPIPTVTLSSDATTTTTTTPAATASSPASPTVNPPPATTTASRISRGQWTQYTQDGKSFGSVLFVGNGTAPYDVLADGTTSVNGQTMQQAEGGSGGPNAQLGLYSSGGIYVPSINQVVTLLTSGHSAGGSNEVNVFDMATGTWNPGGTRPVNPTVRLYMPVGGTWPSAIAYGGIHPTAPLGLVDTGNNYSANISASQRGIQAACVNRQIYGGIADMPGFNKVFLFGGFGYWNANIGSVSMGCTYDYVAKKYQLLDAETWPAGVETNVTSAVWDSTYNRVLFTTEYSLYAYYPGRTQGSRVQIIVNGDGCGSDNCSIYTAVWDAKRKRLLLFNGQANTNRYYDFSRGEFSPPPATTFAVSGSGLATNRGPGVLYDPVGDVYVHHAIGQTLVRIDPTTFVGTAISPSGGATPTTAMNGGQYEHYRFFYWAAQDAYVAMPTGDTVGVYVYPPLR